MACPECGIQTGTGTDTRRAITLGIVVRKCKEIFACRRGDRLLNAALPSACLEELKEGRVGIVAVVLIVHRVAGRPAVGAELPASTDRGFSAETARRAEFLDDGPALGDQRLSTCPSVAVGHFVEGGRWGW